MRFYADYGSAKAKRKGGDAPNALVIWTENGSYIRDHEVTWEGRMAVFECADSGLNTGSVSQGYLRSSCKRISRAEAFRIHPTLARDVIDSKEYTT